MTDVASLPAALTALVGRLRDGDWNMRTPEELAEAVADAIMEALAARSPAPSAGVVDTAMVERALRHQAFQEDGAQWPDAYSEEEQAHERERMRGLLTAAHDGSGPFAYCRSCQTTGMSNCQHFDECAGATCITCHRPLNALSQHPAAPSVSPDRETVEVRVATAVEGGLPELPMHKGFLLLHNTGGVSQVWGYTAEQMRAYGEQCRLATPEHSLAAWIISNLLNESQLDVVPSGYSKSLRHFYSEQPGSHTNQTDNAGKPAGPNWMAQNGW